MLELQLRLLLNRLINDDYVGGDDDDWANTMPVVIDDDDDWANPFPVVIDDDDDWANTMPVVIDDADDWANTMPVVIDNDDWWLLLTSRYPKCSNSLLKSSHSTVSTSAILPLSFLYSSMPSHALPPPSQHL